MARLDAPPAAPTAADLRLVTGRLARPWRGQVLLVLAGDPLHRKPAATVRAGRRPRHGDHPIDQHRDRPPRPPAIGRAGLTAWPPGVAGRGVLRERRSLSLGGAPQLLHLGDQLPDTGLQPLVLADKPVDLGAQHRVVMRQPLQPSRLTGPPTTLVVPQPHHHRARTLQHHQRDHRRANSIPLTKHTSPFRSPIASTRTIQIHHPTAES
jgi:hypothetical protein